MKLRELLNESPDEDTYFTGTFMPWAKKQGLLPDGIGRKVGHGYEAIIYSLGADKVIRFHPTYERWPEQVEEILKRYKNAPSGGLFVKIFEVGTIHGSHPELGDDMTFAVYTIMENLDQITEADAEIIDSAITKRSDIDKLDAESKLKEFLKKYLALKIDLDSRNVMMRGSEYVITDPE